jgi:hypothetical protein
MITLINLTIGFLIALTQAGFWTLFLVTPIPYLTFKPFSCNSCMSFWTTILFTFLIINNIYISIVAGMFAYYLVHLFLKTLR